MMWLNKLDQVLNRKLSSSSTDSVPQNGEGTSHQSRKKSETPANSQYHLQKVDSVQFTSVLPSTTKAEDIIPSATIRNVNQDDSLKYATLSNDHTSTNNIFPGNLVPRQNTPSSSSKKESEHDLLIENRIFTEKENPPGESSKSFKLGANGDASNQTVFSRDKSIREITDMVPVEATEQKDLHALENLSPSTSLSAITPNSSSESTFVQKYTMGNPTTTVSKDGTIHSPVLRNLQLEVRSGSDVSKNILEDNPLHVKLSPQSTSDTYTPRYDYMPSLSANSSSDYTNKIAIESTIKIEDKDRNLSSSILVSRISSIPLPRSEIKSKVTTEEKPVSTSKPPLSSSGDTFKDNDDDFIKENYMFEDVEPTTTRQTQILLNSVSSLSQADIGLNSALITTSQDVSSQKSIILPNSSCFIENDTVKVAVTNDLTGLGSPQGDLPKKNLGKTESIRINKMKTNNVTEKDIPNLNNIDDNSISNEKPLEINTMKVALGDYIPIDFDDETSESSDIDTHEVSFCEKKDFDHTEMCGWDKERVSDDLSECSDLCTNCYGVVHLRLLRAKQLPCTPGSQIQVQTSLLPWKGKIRSKKIVSYAGPPEAGVCVRWDVSNSEQRDSNNECNATTEDEINTNPYFSMIHSYNNKDTPIPSILIELKHLSYQMFESNVCSLLLNCQPLINHPGRWRQRWCFANESLKSPTKHKFYNKVTNDVNSEVNNPVIPLILLEAYFQPREIPKSSPQLAGESKKDDESLISTDSLLQSSNFEENINQNRTLSDIPSILLDDHLSTQSFPVQNLHPVLPISSKPHLFRIMSPWIPACCSVCSSLPIWRRKLYECEVCHLVCCSDCQLHVDIDLSCGSEAAIAAVSKAFWSKSNLSKMLHVVAPVTKVKENMRKNSDEHVVNGEGFDELNKGVGIFKIRLLRACIFLKKFPPETELENIKKKRDLRLRNGDYYVRISWFDSDRKKESKRTNTIFQTGKPEFGSEEVVITANDYGSEFLIEVLDADSDEPVGTTLISTQMVLQRKRDRMAVLNNLSFINSDQKSITDKDDATFELRTNIKSGFGLDFYNTKSTEISGWLTIEMNFKENFELFSPSRPISNRLASDFSTELIQVHISRLNDIFTELQSLISTFQYIVSWDNPWLTFLSCIFFVTLCLRLNAEYFGSVPIFILLIRMMYFAVIRKNGGLNLRWIKKERKMRIQDNKTFKIRNNCHRDVGILEVTVNSGKHLWPEHGIPGSLVATISWDPLKFAKNDKEKEMISDLDPSTKMIHHIGTTNSAGLTSFPCWNKMHDSNETLRLKQLSPRTNFLSDHKQFVDLPSSKTQTMESLQFPILQPIYPDSKKDSNLESLTRVLPWSSSLGALVIQVRFSDVINKLPLFDEVLGDVVIPISKLINDGSVEGWFNVLEKGTLKTETSSKDEEIKLKCKDAYDHHAQTIHSDKKSTDGTIDDKNNGKNTMKECPQIFLTAKVILSSHDNLVSDMARESSIAIAEEMNRIASIEENTGLGFLGTSINTYNTMRGVGSSVHNLQRDLGNALDTLEMLKNLLNFSCPEKSSLLFLSFAILWLVFAIIPTRIILVVGILIQYGSTFMSFYNCMRLPEIEPKVETKINQTPKSRFGDEQTPDSISLRLKNFLMSTPTDEDLRRCYYWEACRVVEGERVVEARKKRNARLTKLWKASWFGNLELKVENPSLDSVRYEWKEIFAIVIGHRFIWWENELSFDGGDSPMGQIFFSGHSGLAGLSPIDLRELKQHEVPLIVCIFGRGNKCQEKLSLLTRNDSIKNSLEDSITQACENEKNE